MVEYQVFGSGRTNGCDGGKITHLGIMEKKQMWRISKIIDMIEKQGDKFWTYEYKNGFIYKHTKLEIKVIFDKIRGKFFRTQVESTEEGTFIDSSSDLFFKNNLLELPIYYYNDKNNKWYHCSTVVEFE
jgi:hypothetical protein